MYRLGMGCKEGDHELPCWYTNWSRKLASIHRTFHGCRGWHDTLAVHFVDKNLKSLKFLLDFTCSESIDRLCRAPERDRHDHSVYVTNALENNNNEYTIIDDTTKDNNEVTGSSDAPPP